MGWLASCPKIFMGLALIHFQKYWLLSCSHYILLCKLFRLRSLISPSFLFVSNYEKVVLSFVIQSRVISSNCAYHTFSHWWWVWPQLARAIAQAEGFSARLVTFFTYSSNYMTKKEPKSEARVSKFDWHYFHFFWPHNLNVFLKPIKHDLLTIYWAD